MAITITLTEQDAVDYLVAQVGKHTALVRSELEFENRITLGRELTPEETEDLARRASTIARADRPEAGADPIPLTSGVIVPPVPSSVDVPASLIAPADATGTTLNPAVAFATSAPSLGPVAQTAVVPLPPGLPPVLPGNPVIAAVPILDSTGLQWDARIHASTKARTDDGAWRKKRNVAPELIKTVEAELRMVMALPAPGALSTAPQAPLPPVAQATTATSVPEVAGPSFPDLTVRVAQAIALQKVTQAQVSDLLKEYGIPQWPALEARADIRQVIATRLGI